MKIATVTCRETEFPIERGQLNNVNDLAGSWCFGSRVHIPLKRKIEALRDYDVVWFTMSKQVREYEKYWNGECAYFPCKVGVVYERIQIS